MGRTKWEAIASIIIVSDMALQMNARGNVGDAQGRDTQTDGRQTEAILLPTM